MWYCHKDRATDRDKLIMHSPESPQGCQDHSMEKDDFFQQMVLEQLGSCRGKKNKVGPLPHTTYKNESIF